METMNPWDFKNRFYLQSGNDCIGPFRSMTDAFRHRRDYGPEGWEITPRSDHDFIGSMFPPVSPESHLWSIVNET